MIRQTSEFRSVVIASLATAATATPVLTAAATATKSSALWASLIHREGTPFQGLPVEPLNGALHVFVVGKLDESEPSGFTCHLVPYNGRRCNLEPSIGDEFIEHTVGHTAGKVPHE